MRITFWANILFLINKVYNQHKYISSYLELESKLCQSCYLPNGGNSNARYETRDK